MQIELIFFIAMIVTFLIGAFLLKLPISLSMMLASIAGALVSGHGIPIKHLVEGTFGYIDTILVIATAMMFMKVIEESGALDTLNFLIVRKFHNNPVLLLILIMIIIMFPGMITGSSTAAVLSSGAIVAPVLMTMGIPVAETGAIIAMGAIYGMIAPPVNVPAMIIGGGIDLPYVGFTIPLLLLIVPVAVFTVLFLGLKYAKNFDYEQFILSSTNSVDSSSELVKSNVKEIKLFIPILVLIFLMLASKIAPQIIPNLGMPLIFLISAIVGLFTGKKVNFIQTSKSAVKSTLPVLGILMGVGMFIQIMTLTGVRGFIVDVALSLPSVFLYLGIAIFIPLFGAVSAFGSSSVLGVPFCLALLGKNEIIVAAALSFIAGTGDLVPPTALAGIFAAQVVGEENYFNILKKCIIPVIAIVVWGLVFIIFANPIGDLIL
ncbi:MAG: TRAP transporter large permease subunit [Tissierellia bacterium]|nr:TRAP transporter large permease subunit [Tissierellia bacterium]